MGMVMLSLSSIRGVTCFFFFSSFNHFMQKKAVKEVSLRALGNKNLIIECTDSHGTGKELSWELRNDIICDCCKVGDIDRAMTLLAQLEALGFQPNLISYTLLIEALGNIGRTLEAEAVFHEMICSGFKPRVKVYNVLLRVF